MREERERRDEKRRERSGRIRSKINFSYYNIAHHTTPPPLLARYRFRFPKFSSHRHRRRHRHLRRPARLNGRGPGDALLPPGSAARRQRRRRRRQRPRPRFAPEPRGEPRHRPRVRVRGRRADVRRQERESAEKGVPVAVVAPREPAGRGRDAVAAEVLAVPALPAVGALALARRRTRRRRRRSSSSSGSGRASDPSDPRRVARPLVCEAPLEPVAVVVEPVFWKFVSRGVSKKRVRFPLFFSRAL